MSIKTIKFFGKGRFFHLFIFAVLSVLLIQCKDNAFNAGTDSVGVVIDKVPGSAGNTIALSAEPIHGINIPGNWNGDLLVYAHGYVDPQKDIAIPSDSIEGVPVSSLIENFGMAYATTSYPHTGLNGTEAVADLINLVSEFVNSNGQPNHIYLAGVSEGGLVTAMAIEKHPEIFNAGIAACGPIGDFGKQLNYFGDFHVLFNYFFPEVQIGSPIGIKDQIIRKWQMGHLQKKVKRMINLKPDKALTLLKVAGIPIKDPKNMEEVETAILGILRYNVLATNDAIERLGGEPFENTPFDNSSRVYTGTGSSLEDVKLNRKVERFKADSGLLAVIDSDFSTTGKLLRPLITPHTIYDPIVPFWHEAIYQSKVNQQNSSPLYQNVPLDKFGHCNFSIQEITNILNLVTGSDLQKLASKTDE